MYCIFFEDGQTVIRNDPDLSPNDLGAKAVSSKPIKELKIKNIWEKGQQMRCELMPDAPVQPTDTEIAWNKNILTAIYPEAYFDGDDAIWTGSYPTPEGEEILGFGDTEKEAWADAASRHMSSNAPVQPPAQEKPE